MKTRSSYTYQEDKILLEHWWDRRQRKEVLSLIGKGRSYNALGLRFYKLAKEVCEDIETYKRQMKEKYHNGEIPSIEFQLSNIVHSNPVPEVKSPQLGYEVVYNQEVDDKIESLEKQVAELQKTLSRKEDTFVSWLENILYMYKSGECFADVSLIIKQNHDLTQKIKEYREEIDVLEDKFRREKEQHERVYNELEFWLGQFLKMSSLEKITNLQDFIPRIKAVVDSYGTVIGVSSDNKTLELPSSFQKIS